MKLNIIRQLLALCLALACSGCFAVDIERQVAGAPPKELKQHFFLFGRIGEPEINLTQECPSGVASYGDRFTFTDVLLGLLTVGIYTPRTVVIRCAV